MFKGSREATSEEIESLVPPVQEQAPTVGLGVVANAFQNVFFTMMTQMFEEFMGTTQAPQPQKS
ncbi:hypothetical protein J1N35_005050 [Gossypium stocksii]|uniref:Uncharacterized protein n=1 Tax=Gossypium stocksii TaxID=47602 RepID=A0A9D3WF36_9ROSI|nr:hypothetical protein J1N35_005050 [Gossypium stocksii]